MLSTETTTVDSVACVAGGSGYPSELWSQTRVQKAAQVVRRMGRSLVKLAALPQNVSRAHPLPPGTQAINSVAFRHWVLQVPMYMVTQLK